MEETSYKDPYNFEPLEPALHDCLIDLCDQAENNNFDTIGNEEECKSLEVLGYVQNVAFYWGGGGKGHLTTKGRRYQKDFKDWETRRSVWGRENAKRDKTSVRHGYLMAIVGALAGSVITLLLQFVIGFVQQS